MKKTLASEQNPKGYKLEVNNSDLEKAKEILNEVNLDDN